MKLSRLGWRVGSKPIAPSSRGQAFIGEDLNELLTSPGDHAWLAILFAGAASIARAGVAPQGQLLQDAMAMGVAEATGAPRTFLEIGGGPPIDHSNSYALDRAGWSGVVVEPNPLYGDRYATERTERTRVLAKATTTSSDPSVTLVVAGELSYVEEMGAPPDDIWSEVRADAHERGSTRQVPTIHPHDLWAEYTASLGVPSFLSVDVEGSELQILAELPLSRERPVFVCAEHSGDLSRSRALGETMSSFGYHRILEAASKWDGWFVPDEVHQRLGT